MIWLGLAMALTGIAAARFVFYLNSETPYQIGPRPFFFSAGMAAVGVILFISHL